MGEEWIPEQGCWRQPRGRKPPPVHRPYIPGSWICAYGHRSAPQNSRFRPEFTDLSEYSFVFKRIITKSITMHINAGLRSAIRILYPSVRSSSRQHGRLLPLYHVMQSSGYAGLWRAGDMLRLSTIMLDVHL